ncbi:MAG: M20/M25/M40 family metallo-hydrolase [Deferrisomatales bacterium]|nr:M20/M25/M40 family metallo-hydrolase [Deferrisomatales bacterium]
MPEVRPERVQEVFWGLVERYSPSGKEQEALTYLEEVCAAHGCPYGVQPVDEDRYNLVLGRPDAPLVFVGHVDTVDAWDLEDFGPAEVGGGWVRGLGAADMKGGCAALLEAYLVLREAGLGREVGLALVVGEEEEGDGAAAFLREARPGRVVIAEPTGLQLCTGHYGYVEAVLSARGRRAHASVPELGRNAAEAVLTVLHGLLQEPSLAAKDGPVLSIRHLETSNPGFAVPARAAAWVDLHVPPAYRVERVIGVVDRVVASAGGDAVTVNYPCRHEGFSLDDDDPTIRAYRSAGGRDFGVFRSHSDGNLFHAAGVPAALLGPGSLDYAHTEEERVELAEVIEAAWVFVRLARSFPGV